MYRAYVQSFRNVRFAVGLLLVTGPCRTDCAEYFVCAFYYSDDFWIVNAVQCVYIYIRYLYHICKYIEHKYVYIYICILSQRRAEAPQAFGSERPNAKHWCGPQYLSLCQPKIAEVVWRAGHLKLLMSYK